MSLNITSSRLLTPISVIVGMGEVGKSLKQVLDPHYPIVGVDKTGVTLTRKVNILHICFPYSKGFINEVKKYKKLYKPRHIVIHSTVPVGTSRKVDACHSPIRGIHPFLSHGIRTFAKFIGGEKASEVADYFRRAGIKVILCDKQETTEAGKLFDTEYYKECIKFAKRVKAYCNRRDLNFHEVYTIFNQTYNEGYRKLGYPEVVRPVLQPIMTPIGGHCLIPNSKLLKYE